MSSALNSVAGCTRLWSHATAARSCVVYLLEDIKTWRITERGPEESPGWGGTHRLLACWGGIPACSF